MSIIDRDKQEGQIILLLPVKVWVIPFLQKLRRMPFERPIVHVEFSTGTRPGGRPFPWIAVTLSVFPHRLDLLYSFHIWYGSWAVFSHR
jgi:hypothetical protein